MLSHSVPTKASKRELRGETGHLLDSLITIEPNRYRVAPDAERCRRFNSSIVTRPGPSACQIAVDTAQHKPFGRTTPNQVVVGN